MSGFSIMGSYSGIDRATIDQLMEAERIPLNKLNAKKTSITGQQNAWKDINTRLKSLFDKIKVLQSPNTFESKKASSTASDIVGVSSDRNGAVGSYKVSVKQLATSARFVGGQIVDAKKGQDNNTELKMNGEFTINFDRDAVKEEYLKDNKLEGKILTIEQAEAMEKHIEDYKEARTIKIENSDSLSDIAKKINAKGKGTGVDAAIIDGRLTLTNKETGEKEINLENTGKEDILSGLKLDSREVEDGEVEDGEVEDRKVEGFHKGQGAIFTVDGIEIESDSNSVKNAIEGVTLDLKKEHETGKYDTITVGVDTDKASKAVKDFVDQYNSTMSFIEDKLKAGVPDSPGSAGVLAADNSLMRLHSTLRNLVTGKVSNEEGAISDLSQLGVSTTDRFGKLEFDAKELTKVLEEDPEKVMAFFYAKGEDGEETGFVSKLNTYIDSFVSTDKGILKGKTESLDKRLKDLDKQIENFEARMVRKEAHYVKMFTALDVAMMQAEDQMSWLQGQVDSMNASRK